MFVGKLSPEDIQSFLIKQFGILGMPGPSYIQSMLKYNKDSETAEFETHLNRYIFSDFGCRIERRNSDEPCSKSFDEAWWKFMNEKFGKAYAIEFAKFRKKNKKFAMNNYSRKYDEETEKIESEFAQK